MRVVFTTLIFLRCFYGEFDMFNRFALCFAFGFQSLFTLVYANDLDKWNSEQGKVVRYEHSDKLEQTTYREISSKPDSSRGGIKTVYPQIETKAQIKGSNSRIVADAILDTSVDAVKRDWKDALKSNAPKVAKGVLGGVVVGMAYNYAYQQFMEGLDWVMGEGGKIQKKPEINLDNPFASTNEFYYQDNCRSNYHSTVQAAAILTLGACYLNPIWISDVVVQPYVDSDVIRPIVKYTYTYNGERREAELVIYKYRNPNYVSSNSRVDVSDSDIDKAVNDVVDNAEKDASKKKIADAMANASYARIWDENGRMTEIGGIVKDAQKDILKTDDPKKDKKTDKTPKIENGTETDGEITPKEPEPEYITDPQTGEQVPNPEYDPDSKEGSNFSFQLPAFCDYASIVCDWIDWTKEKPDDNEEEEEQNINDRGIFDREFDIDFFMPSSCPPDYTFTINAHKYLTHTFHISFNWLCIFFSSISYALVFASHCVGAWIFYEITVRRSSQG